MIAEKKEKKKKNTSLVEIHVKDFPIWLHIPQINGGTSQAYFVGFFEER